MNELSNFEGDNNVVKLEGMMKELINMSIGTNKKIVELSADVSNLGKRMDDFENNSEVTTAQRNDIRRAVNRQVYMLLEVPARKQDWTLEDRIKVKKYSQLFHQRCYSETSRKGHLASPYGTTISQNFIQAIRDIEAWTPSNGIDGLMREADENATATKIASEQGYI